MMYLIESVGSKIVHLATLEAALEFARRYSDENTMMAVYVWKLAPRQYVGSFVDGRQWDSATEVQASV